MHSQKDELEKMVRFLNEINIPVIEKELNDDTFLPGLELKGQSIFMDRKQLKYPGDLLHEAGHIAVTDPEVRPLIGTDKIDENWPDMGDEIVAILWSFAAAHHLNLNLNVVFHPNGYRGASDWFIEEFSGENYMGLPLLEWMGMCSSEEFPVMRKWVR